MLGFVSWRIRSWERDRGRGSIESEHSEQVFEFDASIAMVDDFRVGEAVEIELKRKDGGLVVARIEPVASRPRPGASGVELPEAVRADVEHANRILAESLAAVTIASYGTHNPTMTERLVLRVYHGEWPPPSRPIYGNLSFVEVAYLQMPVTWDVWGRQLAAYRWEHFKERAEADWSCWSIDPMELEDSIYVFAFESPKYGEPSPLVVAEHLVVDDP